MRTILRAAGRTARGFLWIVKGLLLLLALAVLVLWPMSRGKSLMGEGQKFTVRPERVDRSDAGIVLSNGRIAAWHQTLQFLNGKELALGRDLAVRLGERWEWSSKAGNSDDSAYPRQYKWGPLRWLFKTDFDPDYASEERAVSAPCWLIAPLLALWPVTSRTLFMCRRTRRRRRIATGCCLSCGYDLRATPSPGGEILSRCPECGAAAAASV